MLASLAFKFGLAETLNLNRKGFYFVGSTQLKLTSPGNIINSAYKNPKLPFCLTGFCTTETLCFCSEQAFKYK